MNRIVTTTTTLLAGAACATALILACGDDSPADADAAPLCDCPAAEAPLAGRIVFVDQVIEPDTIGQIQATARCEDDWVLLGGGCTVESGNPHSLILNTSGTSPNDITSSPLGGDYRCYWKNPDNLQIDAVRARAICLVPAAE